MSRRTLRTLTLVDALALIAATAAALAIARAAQPGLQAHHTPAVLQWIYLSSPFGILWMLSIFGLRFLPPRPPLRRLARRPGMVACCVAAVYTLWTIAEVGLLAAGGRIPPNFNLWSNLVTNLGFQAGSALPAAWITLAFSGRWRPESSWFDRTSRLIGAYFILMFWGVPLVVAWMI
jgi:hypothetical protein